MTRIIFYSNLADKHSTLVNIVQQALNKRHLVTVIADSEQAASQLNSALWKHGVSDFLPNVLAVHAHAAMTPVLIDWQQKDLLQDDILINLTQNQLSCFSRFRQLIELVSHNEADKMAARQRFKFYRDRGYEIKHIDEASLN